MLDAAKKTREPRIFGDDAGKVNRDVREIGGEILAVSQFTLAGSIAKGASRVSTTLMTGVETATPRSRGT